MNLLNLAPDIQESLGGTLSIFCAAGCFSSRTTYVVVTKTQVDQDNCDPNRDRRRRPRNVCFFIASDRVTVAEPALLDACTVKVRVPVVVGVPVIAPEEFSDSP